MGEYIRQNFVDLARAPERGVVLTRYNENVSSVKDALSRGFRLYLDTFPSSYYLSDGSFELDFPFILSDGAKKLTFPPYGGCDHEGKNDDPESFSPQRKGSY